MPLTWYLVENVLECERVYIQYTIQWYIYIEEAICRPHSNSFATLQSKILFEFFCIIMNIDLS